VTNHAGIDTEPFWGKDGQTLYFTSDRAGKPQIYKTNINSGAVSRVTFVGNYNANPKLSADEKLWSWCIVRTVTPFSGSRHRICSAAVCASFPKPVWTSRLLSPPTGPW
jgi:hypothetical protein